MGTHPHSYACNRAANPELKTFGDRLRLLKKAKGLSQEQLAELPGLHRNYIGGIERGERNVAPFNRLHLAKAWGVSGSKLI